MGMEPAHTLVEVWPVAADSAGIWLLDEPWISGPVMSDDIPHSEVNHALWRGNVEDEQVKLVHSTSWRSQMPHVVLTYLAVVALDAAPDVLERWPNARPIAVGSLLDEVGAPVAGPATAPPEPRHLHVLLHGIRHLRWLLDNDAEAAPVLRAEGWERWLWPLGPDLARMYQDDAI